MATLCAAGALWAQTAREPYIGYAYPAGGKQGTAFQVSVGGQFLNGASAVYVTGTGVRASVVQYIGPLGPLNKEQLDELARRLEEIRNKRLGRPTQAAAPAAQGKDQAAAAKPAVALPDIPQLRNLDQLTPAQLRKIANDFLGAAKKKAQAKTAIAETVIVQVTLDANADPGDRELRLATPLGLTNPLRFQVVLLPEVKKQEANESATALLTPLDLPVVLNGQILPGAVDRFRLRAKRGQKLVIQAEARRLVPYLADAVPGWFEAALTLCDPKGEEVAYADHYRADLDPVILYEVPQDGDYTLKINDTLYRGRDDFVYRISVGELPFVTQIFPLGGTEGKPTTASVAGWNLPWDRVQLDTQPGLGHIREVGWRSPQGLTNWLLCAVDTLPEVLAVEPNNTPKNAQRVTLPVIVNGRISHPGDVNVFRFEGRAGDEVVAEVCARRLGSPLDSLLRLSNAAGRVLAWNDDFDDKGAGLVTHQADSYLCAKLPETGAYYVQLSDTQHHGGDEYAYRLRIAPKRPDFALRLTPSSVNVPAGRAAPICVYALRQDGFDGDIEVALKNAPAGFAISGGRIPAGLDHVRMTLTAPRMRPGSPPVVLQFEGYAQLRGATVVRPVVPAEDMMQAFAYRHLVPSRELMVAVKGAGRFAPVISLAANGPVRIPASGMVQVRVNAPGLPMVIDRLHLQLSEPPDGVTLQSVNPVPGGLMLALKADKAKVGYADNLIVEMSADVQPARPANNPAKAKQRVPVGVLPAIPFEIVKS
jgi:hypothetical protein